jgi:hypothetical protein
MDHVTDLNTPLSWTTNGMPSGAPTTPITGHGRRAATLCARDADCPSPELCTPIGSYLEVRELENDCRRPAGTAIGGSTCARNSDCASDLCFSPSAGRLICFDACAGTGAPCNVGTCTVNAASVDLDGIRAGLGSRQPTPVCRSTRMSPRG